MNMSNDESVKSFLKNADFKCQKCSACCRYEPGAVFLTEDDVNKICNYLSIDTDSFLKKYCRGIFKGGKLVVSLLEKDNYDCIFWDNGCTIYDARPLQCVTYPFWPSLVESERNWIIESKRCIGINKKGEMNLSLKYKYYKLEKNAEIMEMK